MPDVNPPNRTSRVGAIVSVAIGLAVVLAPAALAGAAYTSTDHYSANGKSYYHYAGVFTNTSSHSALSQTKVGLNSGSVGGGWMGAQGRLYTSSGALSCSGTMTYNGSTVSSPNGVYGNSCTRYQVGTWYGSGVTQAWMGSYYANFYTGATPNQNS